MIDNLIQQLAQRIGQLEVEIILLRLQLAEAQEKLQSLQKVESLSESKNDT